MDVKELKASHNLLKEFSYDLVELDHGYAGKTLYINLDNNTIAEKPVTPQMKEKFIGGKGFGLRLLWDGTRPETKWNDNDNEIIISGGPICGITQYAGSGKSLVVSISPTTDVVIDSNVGGYFGPYLKFSGYDALEIQGKAKKDVIIVIDGTTGKVSIEEAGEEYADSHLLAEQLTEMYAESDKPIDKMKIAVVSAGSAADHSYIGMLNFSFYDLQRKVCRLKQAGRGGIGTVFRDKGIRAIVAKSHGVKGDMNHVEDMPAIQQRGKKFTKEMNDFDDDQCQMRKVGTAHLMEIMDAYDILPTHNFQYGKAKDVKKNIDDINSKVWTEKFTPRSSDGCWLGCTMACAKVSENFVVRTGPYKGKTVHVDGPEYESAAGLGSNIGNFDPNDILELNFYCDTYGIDTISFGTMTAFAMECYEKGIINKKITGGLELNFGNTDAALEAMHQMARGEGFGIILGQGTRRMTNIFHKEYGGDLKFMQDIGMQNKGLEYSQYVSKESLAQQGGYAMTNKGPQHDEAWLIFMDMVNNQIPTFDDKAEALHYFPMFRTWFGLMGLCKLPWNDVEPAGNAETDEPAKVPEHVDNYITVYNAVTGNNIDKKEMVRQSERVYNFQRIFNIRRGYGLRKHDAQPYRACGPVTEAEYLSREERYDKELSEKLNLDPTKMSLQEKMAEVRKYREDRYEQLLDAVYLRRGWTKNGVPKLEHLKNIGMDLPELIEVVKPLQ
ncbi:MAG: aldehyde ferredoxin oxidoreductase C-terminal domain-containing protein [Candidatus Stygibacter australis]|nr:aldehyde ferredoxin oxidoreductase C-terminal domain-containing protein [Candidatus Stygibacter australis]MDP8323320.1 aldehyde ferredoxin oxidoreductase C-terminal domain-containing protein [Candidatus Stygibacter australis]